MGPSPLHGFSSLLSPFLLPSHLFFFLFFFVLLIVTPVRASAPPSVPPVPEDESHPPSGCLSAGPPSPLGVPPGAWDSHVHVTDPDRFPPEAGAAYRPGAHTVWDAAAFERAVVGCERVVVVQPSVYGTNNSLLTDTLRAVGPARLRAVVVFDPARADARLLRRWHHLGVRGVRVNLSSRPDPSAPPSLADALQGYAKAVAHLGWVVQVYAPMSRIPEVEDVIPRLGVRVVFDHMGDPAVPSPFPRLLDEIQGFAALLRLLRKGDTWVKISAPYRLSKKPGPLYHDLDPIILELLRVAPSRVVYGSDWPHTRFEHVDIRPWTQHLLNLTAGNKTLQSALFRDNAHALWDSQ